MTERQQIEADHLPPLWIIRVKQPAFFREGEVLLDRLHHSGPLDGVSAVIELPGIFQLVPIGHADFRPALVEQFVRRIPGRPIVEVHFGLEVVQRLLVTGPRLVGAKPASHIGESLSPLPDGTGSDLKRHCVVLLLIFACGCARGLRLARAPLPQPSERLFDIVGRTYVGALRATELIKCAGRHDELDSQHWISDGELKLDESTPHANDADVATG
ncbi:hypothetical protein MPC4_290060 [Methylocella tundrae]|uniref:Uncharacterized protein n=1 Tax=Methylocella tundrae TaxID=227605 RepID=A0A8B6M6Z6_METTU|nr:hypothetical protein MPC4_290060 [Methylocella tundrae]